MSSASFQTTPPAGQGVRSRSFRIYAPEEISVNRLLSAHLSRQRYFPRSRAQVQEQSHATIAYFRRLAHKTRLLICFSPSFSNNTVLSGQSSRPITHTSSHLQHRYEPFPTSHLLCHGRRDPPCRKTPWSTSPTCSTQSSCWRLRSGRVFFNSS